MISVRLSTALFSLLSNSDKSGRVEMETLSWLLSMFYQVVLEGLGESLLPADQTQKQYMEKLLLKCLEYVQSSKVRSQPNVNEITNLVIRYRVHVSEHGSIP